MNRLMPVVAIAPLLALAIPIATLAAEPHQTNAAQLALRWLNCTQQQPNGQIGSSGNPIARSAEVVISLAASGRTASEFHHGASTLADYLKTVTALDVSKTSTPVGTNGVLLLARSLDTGTGPAAVPIAQLELAQTPTGDTKGEYGSDLFSDALAILGLSAAHQSPGSDAIAFLETHQNATDHGWSYDNAGSFGSDSNTSALVIQALLASGVAASDTHITNGMQFLTTQFFNEELEADGGLFPPSRRALMQGDQARLNGPRPDQQYAFLLDVAGENGFVKQGADAPARPVTVRRRIAGAQI